MNLAMTKHFAGIESENGTSPLFRLRRQIRGMTAQVTLYYFKGANNESREIIRPSGVEEWRSHNKWYIVKKVVYF